MKKIFLCFFLVPLFLHSSNWDVFKGNIYFTGNKDQLIIPDSQTKWTFEGDSLLFNPIPVKDQVLVISLNKTVYLLNAQDGSIVWKLNIKSLASRFGSGTRSLGKIKYPVFQDNILILSDASILFAINLLSGQAIWARAGAQELVRDKFVIDGIYSTPLITQNRVFYGSRKYFLSRTLQDGHLLWHSDKIQTYNGFPTPYDAFIFTQNRDYLNYRFDILKVNASNGTILWKKNIERPLILFSPVDFNNQIWVVSTTNLFALDEENGTILKKFTFSEPITAQPGFSDRKLILSLGNHKLIRFNPANGRSDILFETTYSSSPHYVLIEDQIYLAYGTQDGKTAVQALQASDTSKLWTKNLDGGWYGSIPSAAKRTLYVSAGNTLYAIGTPKINALNRVIAQATSTPNADLNIHLDQIQTNIPVVLNNIYFEYNKSYLKAESQQTLDYLVGQLKTKPYIKLKILGHTDSTGDSAYNQVLSEKRAYSVVEYLVKHGISPKRLSAVGVGEGSPIADNQTEEGRKLNRRTEFMIVK